MKAAIYTQKRDLDTFLYLSRFISELNKRNVTAVLHKDTAEGLQFSKVFPIFSNKEDLKDQEIDYFFSFGGDGTILNALIFVQDLGIPVVGVNTGRLGFLASFTKEEVFDNIDKVLNKELIITQRSVIKVNGVNIDFPYALNDVTISRKETTSMITVNSYINDEFLNVFWGDGLIISTPTGSTAYSLSCGGPIISPENDNFAITPIAPHNLNVRPLILKDDVKIRLKVESRVPQYSLSLDSRLYHIDTLEEISLEKAPFTLSLVQPDDISFFETIRQKLLWGNDKRN
ncbi:NAD kinase [Elizabethkingia anophelis]|uniref:NAD kinase n=3 Tax=Elizabethkingia anophelis TaxID=1117645 RepID=X5KYQ7_9FLAO|nr:MULTISPECIES: NAD kinase [Elizabethkingia]AIL47734.1 NAD kinase [Elizabethkingia anophelis NUHP1]AKH96184.1 inorganic polyphosphate/ATP-NAD kinase [Elizabethkingia anophelis FMS-007]AMR42166.1 NAD kinase [Elizabethkingia anophelis]AMX48806.1 NAD kinase [Elizabethkingia anophelis]AMX52264.1 NAD kinase [Elizabethkingia anophelis]